MLHLLSAAHKPDHLPRSRVASLGSHCSPSRRTPTPPPAPEGNALHSHLRLALMGVAPGSHSALATTRRGRLQLSRVCQVKSRKWRVGLPVFWPSSAAAASSAL